MMSETLEEIRRKGLEALRKTLGRAGMIRFLQQFSTGSGDYARTRHEWVDRMSLEQIFSLARQARKKQRAKKTTKK
jgi:hypothetical protein